METFSKKLAGSSLLIGSIMAILTMVLHPLGGDLQHIVKIKGVLIFSHSLAIACMPLIAFGLWGLSKTLETNNRLSTLAFFIAFFGLAAATLAATLNGLVLPQFASNYLESDLDPTYLQAIADYGRFFNKSLAYIFMAAIVISIFLFSILLVAKPQFFKWLGYYGIVVVVFGSVALFSPANMTSVSLFGAFVFGMSSWLVLVGVQLLRQAQPLKGHS